MRISVAELHPSVLSHFGQLREQKHKVGEKAEQKWKESRFQIH